MTNEELQTLIKNACKAAGWQIDRMAEHYKHGVIVWIAHSKCLMRPYDEDGDSRALQVECKIALHFEVIGGEWCAEACSQINEESTSVCAYEQLKDDDRKAARLAVLRCAGMIGEAME